jgi:hypothetical protein
MNKTPYEIGIEIGREIERREYTRELLVERFGSISNALESRLDHMSILELVDLTKAIHLLNSLEDLNKK